MSDSHLPTMRDIAREAGVATSTVSKALRGDPSIPESRCQQIREIAAKLGYRTNPMVAALMAQLHNRRRRADPFKIAWVDLWPPGTGRTVIFERLLAGARARADELGFGIEVYNESKLDPQRLRRLLIAKSHWGFIIPPVPDTARDFPLDVRGLTGVTIGTSLRTPVLHRVRSNHFQGGVMAFEKMTNYGCKRVGLVMSPEMNVRVERKWLGAVMAMQQELPASRRVPPCITGLESPDVFLKWLATHRPDGMLAAERRVLAWLDNLPAAKRPKVGSLMHEGRTPDIPGLDSRFEHVGAVACDMVVGQIHRNERGCPNIAHAIEVDVRWQEVGTP